jgi:hypothetical protein
MDEGYGVILKDMYEVGFKLKVLFWTRLSISRKRTRGKSEAGNNSFIFCLSTPVDFESAIGLCTMIRAEIQE